MDGRFTALQKVVYCSHSTSMCCTLMGSWQFCKEDCLFVQDAGESMPCDLYGWFVFSWRLQRVIACSVCWKIPMNKVENCCLQCVNRFLNILERTCTMKFLSTTTLMSGNGDIELALFDSRTLIEWFDKEIMMFRNPKNVQL